MPNTLLRTPVAGILPLFLVSTTVVAQVPDATIEYVPETPSEAVGILEQRSAEQRTQALAQLRVQHDFTFEDQRTSSGITFVHRATEDGTKFFKPVHYDHGNGLSLADVDGDGRLDLYFLTQIGSNELWRNLGDGRFENITESAGIGVPDRISVAAAFADLDNDGDPDLYVTTVRQGNLLFENVGGRFRDRTAGSGLDLLAHSSTPIFFDYDNDGALDLFLTNVGVYTTDQRGTGDYFWGRSDAFMGHLHPDRTELSPLLHNLGDWRWEDVSDQVGLVDGSWTGDATIVDWNRDRLPDLFVPNMQGDDHYWENRGEKGFVDRTSELFKKTPWGTMGVKSFDYDNDGDFDLFLTDMHSDMSEEVGPHAEQAKSRMQWSEEQLQGGDNNIFGNAFFRQENGAFEEISDSIGMENYWPWGLSTADLNADGFLDVFISSSMNFPYRYGTNSLKLNNQGEAFVSVEFLLGVEPRINKRTKTHWFDLDCTTADRPHPLCRQRQGRVSFWASVGTRTSAIFDLEGDGDLDIVTGEFHDRPQVLVSNLAERHTLNWVEVAVEGTSSNRDGLGALVRVEAGDLHQVRYIDGKSGYLSQSSMPLYFGLGEHESVDRVEVLWPSGTVQVKPGPMPAGSRIALTEPKGAEPE